VGIRRLAVVVLVGGRGRVGRKGETAEQVRAGGGLGEVLSH